MRVGCLVQRLMATTLMSKSVIPYQLGLKERRDASSAAPPRASLRQARCPWGPQYCAVYDRLVLPDVEMPQGPLARVVGAALPAAYGDHHCLAPSVRHPHIQDALGSSALLEPDAEELHSPLSPLGSLREPCQHTCLKHLYRNLWTASVAKSLAVRASRAQGDTGVLPTISNKEPFLPRSKKLPEKQRS